MFRISALLLLVGWSTSLEAFGLVSDEEDKAVARLKILNGRIERDEKQPGKPVVAVTLNSELATDVVWKDLAPLTSVTELDLRFTNVTGKGAKKISGLIHLRRLELYGTRITDAGLKELAALRNLTYLGLDFTKVTDAERRRSPLSRVGDS